MLEFLFSLISQLPGVYLQIKNLGKNVEAAYFPKACKSDSVFLLLVFVDHKFGCEQNFWIMAF